jgi:hypothetical protein
LTSQKILSDAKQEVQILQLQKNSLATQLMNQRLQESFSSSQMKIQFFSPQPSKKLEHPNVQC